MQLAALKRAKCSHLFEDKSISGATTKRPALSRCLKTLRAGDTLIVWKLDRLGRSLRDLTTMLDDCHSPLLLLVYQLRCTGTPAIMKHPQDDRRLKPHPG